MHTALRLYAHTLLIRLLRRRIQYLTRTASTTLSTSETQLSLACVPSTRSGAPVLLPAEGQPNSAATSPASHGQSAQEARQALL